MDTSQLKCMIECDPVLKQSILGVFAADRLPTELLRTPFGFIANTDIHAKPGRHWCAFFSNIRGHIDFFDTYGRTPNQNSQYFKEWLKSNGITIRTNHIQIQSDGSTLCGLYCVLFLHQRLIGCTYQDFLNVFDMSAVESNDKFVADTMLQAYHLCVGNDLNHTQMCTSLLNCL